MKKIITNTLIILLVISSLLLCSCREYEYEKYIEELEYTPQTPLSSETETSEVEVFVTPVGLSIESYREYKSFIKNVRLPEGFFEYKDIKHFGKFDSMQIPDVANFHSFYAYNLIDHEGNDISIGFTFIGNDTEYFFKDTVIVDPSDMRTADMTEDRSRGSVYYNEKLYRYYEGELGKIQLYENGWMVSIGLRSGSFCDGTFEDRNSAIGKLIYLE